MHQRASASSPKKGLRLKKTSLYSPLLTIDRTLVLHFPDQLFICYDFLTVCRLHKKTGFLFSRIAAVRRLIVQVHEDQ